MRNLQNTHTLPMKITPWLTLFRKIIVVCCDNRADQLSTVERIYYCLISSFHHDINEIRAIYRYDAATCRDGYLDPWRCDRQLALKRRYETTILHCVKFRKNQNLFNIIQSMRCDYDQPHTPTNVHNLYKIANHPYTWNILPFFAKICLRQRDINTKEYKIITSNLHAQC